MGFGQGFGGAVSVDNVTLQKSSAGILSIKDQGVDTAQLKDSGVTAGKTAATIMKYADTRFEFKAFDRAMTDAAGDVVINGLAGTPKKIFIIAVLSGKSQSVGSGDASSNQCEMTGSSGIPTYRDDHCIEAEDGTGSGTYQMAAITAIAPGQFTLTWIKNGSPAGTLKCFALILY